MKLGNRRAFEGFFGYRRSLTAIGGQICKYSLQPLLKKIRNWGSAKPLVGWIYTILIFVLSMFKILSVLNQSGVDLLPY